jgi:SAM-dependent methyltransferase
MHDELLTTTCENYDFLSIIYRELITATGHLDQENQLLLELVQEYEIGQDDQILDAACGTGDALHYLSNRGFTQLFGLDGSTGMLRKARDYLQDAVFEYCSWSQLEDAHILTGRKMSFIFIFSNSLAHAEKSVIQEIIRSFYDKMSNGGVLLLDTRVWIKNNEGALIEPDRPINGVRYLASIFAEDSHWRISDCCTYARGRQWITYHCETINIKPEQKRSIEISVSYALISADEIARMCSEAGFQIVRTGLRPPWPYVLVEAMKTSGSTL